MTVHQDLPPIYFSDTAVKSTSAWMNSTIENPCYTMANITIQMNNADINDTYTGADAKRINFWLKKDWGPDAGFTPTIITQGTLEYSAARGILKDKVSYSVDIAVNGIYEGQYRLYYQAPGGNGLAQGYVEYHTPQ